MVCSGLLAMLLLSGFATQPQPAGTARVGYTETTAVAGGALEFAGRGFPIGEQVIARLDDGVVEAAPLVVGAAGEVTGTLPLPADLRGGTHVLTLAADPSGTVAQTEVTVRALEKSGDLVVGSATAPDVAAPPAWVYLVALVAAFAAFVALLVWLAVVVARRRTRRRR